MDFPHVVVARFYEHIEPIDRVADVRPSKARGVAGSVCPAPSGQTVYAYLQLSATIFTDSTCTNGGLSTFGSAGAPSADGGAFGC